jgi:hypothetical protein
VNGKLFQCKTVEESAVGNKKELTSRSQVATDRESVTVPNNSKHYSIFTCMSVS